VFFDWGLKNTLIFSCVSGGVSKNKWVQEYKYRPTDKGELQSVGGDNYPLGFHAYVTEREAKKGGLCGGVHRVELRDIVSSGWQDGQRVVVAKRMKILPEKKRGK